MARYISKQHALGHALRRRLLQAVEAHPGSSLTDIAKTFDVSPSTVLWHARKLEAADLLGTERCGQRRLFYSRRQGTRARREGLQNDALRDDTAACIWDAVRRRPGLTIGALAGLVGAGAAAVRRQVSRLVRAGLVHQDRHGVALRIYPRAGAVAA